MAQHLTASEVAAALKLTRPTIYRWAREGKIPSLKLSARARRFDLERVQEALRQAEQPVAASA